MQDFVVGDSFMQYSTVYDGTQTKIKYEGQIREVTPVAVVKDRTSQSYVGFVAGCDGEVNILYNVSNEELGHIEDQKEFIDRLLTTISILEYAPLLGVNTFKRGKGRIFSIGEPKDIVSFIKYATRVAFGIKPKTQYLQKMHKWIGNCIKGKKLKKFDDKTIDDLVKKFPYR